MRREYPADPHRVLADPSEGARMAALVRFKPLPADGPKHLGVRKTWRARLAVLRERAWRR